MFYLEIRDQVHLMDFEGSSDTKPTKKQIEIAVYNKGFIAKNIDITYDDMFYTYRFSGDLFTSPNKKCLVKALH